jgi:kynureninase
VLTGWFAEFHLLGEHGGRALRTVSYGAGAAAFAGATYDPTSHYRAAAVFGFHVAQGLTPDRLRAISIQQVGLLERAIVRLDLDPAIVRVVAVPPDRRAGFLAIRSPHASKLAHALRQHAVFADSRADILRLGPAPYVSDEQLLDAATKLSRVVTAV